MPLFDFECPEHGTFEVLYKKTSDICDFERCPECGTICDQCIPLPSMQPDKYWSGVEVAGEYITSTKEYKKATEHLVPATRDTKEYIQKRFVEVKKQKAEKASSNLRKHLEKELSGVEISPDGYSVKQKNKYKRIRQI